MESRRLNAPLTILVVTALMMPMTASPTQAETTVILVRHAEKQGGADPHLTPEGFERAQALIEVTDGITAVYATETCRTVQTVDGLAVRYGLTIQVQDFGERGLAMDHCNLTAPVEALPHSVGNLATLADHILANEQGGTVIVAGHSNTIPDLVEALGAEPLCPGTFPLREDGACHIPDEGAASEYDNLFVVTVPGPVRLVRTKYGD